MIIDNNIPIPPKSPKRGDDSLVYSQMKVGDSVLLEGEVSTHECKFYRNAQQWGRANDIKFTGRKVEGGVRIWRVE